MEKENFFRCQRLVRTGECMLKRMKKRDRKGEELRNSYRTRFIRHIRKCWMHKLQVWKECLFRNRIISIIFSWFLFRGLLVKINFVSIFFGLNFISERERLKKKRNLIVTREIKHSAADFRWPWKAFSWKIKFWQIKVVKAAIEKGFCGISDTNRIRWKICMNKFEKFPSFFWA